MCCIRTISVVIMLSVPVICLAVSPVSRRRRPDLAGRGRGLYVNIPDRSPSESTFRMLDTSYVDTDTMTVVVDGKDVSIMRAVKDESTGEMVATKEIKGSFVTALFRNVAERGGRVTLQFAMTVPSRMLNPRWQLRFHPVLHTGADSVPLDDVILTGKEYRRAQLKGYQQYERFISRIADDSLRFVNVRALEIFLKRNLPQIYKFRSDSTEVSDDEFSSCFGVTERMAVEHYTDRFAKRLNESRKRRRDKMYSRFVKSPIVTEHVRLDTVINDNGSDFTYCYVQSIDVSGNLRKAGIVLSGEAFESDRRLFAIPDTDTLVYYISSLAGLADLQPRYRVKIIGRTVTTRRQWNLGFMTGSSVMDESLGDNRSVIDSIRFCMDRLSSDNEYELDSISICAFASPEGPVGYNSALSARRAESAARYFSACASDLPMGSHTCASGENWPLLDVLVDRDTLLTEMEKMEYSSLAGISDLDRREQELGKLPFYSRLKSEFYPRLRSVCFDFKLSRRGMVQDTVHTRELDTLYMHGVRLLTERDYDGAALVLAPYEDFNTAVAFMSLGRNSSAMRILKGLPGSAAVDYLLAILYSRSGDESRAVGKYLAACGRSPAFVHRGNLDPEISSLIEKYGLNDYQADNNK